MASKSPDNNKSLAKNIDEAKKVMEDIETHMKTLEGYNRDLDALHAEGLNKKTDQRFEELKANIKMIGEEINRLFRVLGDDVGPVDPALGFGGGAKEKEIKRREQNENVKEKDVKQKRSVEDVEKNNLLVIINL